MKSKWFLINEKEKEFYSRKAAITLKHAWEKTLEKWELREKGFRAMDVTATCGLCNIYFPDSCKDKCPLTSANYGVRGVVNSCVPFLSEPSLEYLFLLFVKEATK